MHLVLAGLSECYDKGNILSDYCSAEVYLHAFSATALDGDVPLTSNSVGYFPEETNHSYALHSRHSVTIRKDVWTRKSSLAQLWEPNCVRKDRSLINMDSEIRRLQTISPYIFGLYSSVVSRGKRKVVCYLMLLYMSSSGTTG
jgi:hypothetical protein